MRVPAWGRRGKPLRQAEMGFGAVADAIRGTGRMPERWGTPAHWGTFQEVLHYLEVTL
jgi:hypothetical protein